MIHKLNNHLFLGCFYAFFKVSRHQQSDHILNLKIKSKHSFLKPFKLLYGFTSKSKKALDLGCFWGVFGVSRYQPATQNLQFFSDFFGFFRIFQNSKFTHHYNYNHYIINDTIINYNIINNNK